MPLEKNNIKVHVTRLRSRLRTLPVKVGDVAVLFAKERFAQSNWIGNYPEAWPKRLPRSRWGITRRNKGRGILIDTGRLRRSIRILTFNSTSVIVGSDVPYAKAHNDGYRGPVKQQVKAHKRKKTKLGIVNTKTLKTRTKIKFGRQVVGETMVKSHERTIKQNLPRRRYIGQSPYLDKQIIRLINSEIRKSFN